MNTEVVQIRKSRKPHGLSEYEVLVDGEPKILAPKAMLCRLCPANCMDRIRPEADDLSESIVGLGDELMDTIKRVHGWMRHQLRQSNGGFDILSYCQFGAHSEQPFGWVAEE
jgi:hypothetical protein